MGNINREAKGFMKKQLKECGYFSVFLPVSNIICELEERRYEIR